MSGRNEWKYIIDSNEEILISNNLLAVLEKDEHTDESNKYVVHSLYFDDAKFTCANDTEAGEYLRFKWRIRYYNKDYSKMFLEKKIKINGRCYKKHCPLTIEEYLKIIDFDIDDLLFCNKKLLQELLIDIIVKNFKPVIIITYEREAFVESVTNTRITIDSNILVTNDIEAFLDNSSLYHDILDCKHKILEIKFDDILPSYIQKVFDIMNLNITSFSKYYLGFNKLFGRRNI